MSAAIWTPNLLIPGVAKCGTTTIYNLLENHPRVSGGIEKEVRFLMDAGDDLETSENVREKGIEGWRDRFPARGQGNFDIWMDASPQYQFQKVALDTITALPRKPQVLFVVREASRRLFSMYQFARYHQRTIPWIGSFAEFVDAVRNPADPRITRQRMLANAWRDSHYDESITPWRAALPLAHLKIIWIGSLATDRDKVLTDLAQWLEIDPEPLVSTPVPKSNPTVVTRSVMLRKYGGRVARVLPEGPAIRWLKDRIKALNSGAVDKNELEDNTELLRSLEKEFASSMERTEALRLELEDEIAKAV